MGNWAFSWVQVVAHSKKTVLLILALVSLLLLSGLSKLNYSVVADDFLLLGLGLLVITAVVGYFLESPKIAVLQLVLSSYVVGASLGLFGWLGYELTAESILGLMIIMTVMSSNLVHLLATLSREMARGLFQFDAIAEALKLNISPIFLSNLTTALGFVFVAEIMPELQQLSWLVVTGVSLSLFTVLTWLPLVVLNWLLEFRVGNTADRHGITFVAKLLQENHLIRTLTLIGGIAVSILVLVLSPKAVEQIESMLWLLGLFAVLFWLAWQSVSIALLNLAINLTGLLLSIAIFFLLYKNSEWVWLLWMVPLGIVVDDGIHFFSRYMRAKRGVFSDNNSAVTYAIASVGRPVWITSWVLLAALSVLMFSSSELVRQAVSLTALSLIITTILILWVLPAVLLRRS